MSRGDIAVLTLEADAPVEIPRYSLYGGHGEIGKSFVLAGFGLAGFGPVGEDQRFDLLPTKRAGLNRYEAIYGEFEDVDFLVYDFDSGRNQNNSLALSGFSSDLGFGVDEVFSAAGDSGGPGFLNGAIASVVAFGDRLAAADVNNELDGSWGEASFDTRVSQFREFIMNATDGQAVFVPESGSRQALLLVAIAGTLRRRRERKSLRPSASDL
jgi:hypothetical protein